MTPRIQAWPSSPSYWKFSVPRWIETKPDFFRRPALISQRVSALSVPCLTSDSE